MLSVLFRGFVALLAFSVCPDSSAWAGDKKDIYLVVWDTTRSDHLSAYGYEMKTWPLDRAHRIHHWVTFVLILACALLCNTHHHDEWALMCAPPRPSPPPAPSPAPRRAASAAVVACGATADV